LGRPSRLWRKGVPNHHSVVLLLKERIAISCEGGVRVQAEKEREKEKRGELSSETLAPPPLADDRHESKTPSENVGPVTGIEEEK